MLINTQQILSQNQLPPPEETDYNHPNPDITSGYIKYGLYARKTIYFHAFYKAYDLESFKADLRNARILADILSSLIKYFIPVPSSWAILTTPQRAHTEKLGYHFASEILKITAEETGITFLENVIGAKNKSKIQPEFFQLKPLPENTPLILFDDIFTTGKTIYTCLDVLKSNPSNHLSNINIPVIVGINNN